MAYRKKPTQAERIHEARKRSAQQAWNAAHKPADPAMFTTQQNKMETGTPISGEQFHG